jgi:hypothetical protein
MKCTRLLLVCCLLLAFALPAWPAETPTSRAAIKLNGSVIGPGDSMLTLFSVAGPPDRVLPVRGKEPSGDFVSFSYDASGLAFHIRSAPDKTSIIDAIVVLGDNVKLVGVPFKVGDDYQSVFKSWGKPERQERGFLAYWKRGVYVGVTDSGQISLITLASPGQFKGRAAGT